IAGTLSTFTKRFQALRAELGGRRPLVVAHRGNRVLCPENTLAAFRLALAQGAHAIETDLRFSRDNVIVLHHDATLERMTDGSGPVRGHTLAELKSLRTRSPKGGAAGTLVEERIPTLLELIELTQGEVPLLLELKDPLFLNPGHAQVLADLLAATNMLEKAAVASFHFEHVLAVRAVAPTIPIGFITMNRLTPKSGADLLGPLWPLLYANPSYVRTAHAMGAVVAPLDPTPETRVRRYLAMGVDALLADNPAAVLAALDAALEPEPKPAGAAPPTKQVPPAQVL
ncbi:MAG: glycerophosphodiester phosphodiesterase, partial [Caldilineaceae bacterium]